MPTKESKMIRKYGALRIISSIMIFVGWAIMLGGGAATFISFPSLTALIYLLGGLFFGLLAFAVAELIYVLIDIEINTRDKQKASSY